MCYTFYMKKILLIIIVVLIVAGLAIVWQFKKAEAPTENVNGNQVQNLGNALEKKDLIVVETPQPNSVLPSSFEIKGQARGYWFFEASFPIVLLAEDGTVLLESYVMTADEWMTEDFVSFAKTFQFEKPENVKRGTLILKKDNPSGLPEHDDALEIPILFEEL